MSRQIRLRRFMVIVWAVAIVAAAGPAVGTAQDDIPVPGKVALTYLPVSDAFGPGWRRYEPSAVTNLPVGTFRENATVVYGGPEGSRVILTVLVVDQGRVRRGWDDAGTLFDTARYELAYDYAVEEQLRDQPPPPGCAEAKRIVGRTYFDGFETGITLCAADPDVILLVVASGRVNDAAGFAASDDVVVAALEAAGTEQPVDENVAATGVTVAIEAFDIGWSDARVRAAPGDTVAISNAGAAPHTFVVEALGIRIEVAPGETAEAIIPPDTAPGTHPFLCDVPGHEQAGMVGELVIE